MNITHYIAPCQTGKTTKAINIYRQNLGINTFFVVGNHNQTRLLKRMNVDRRSIIHINNLGDFFRGKVCNGTLIVDDYLTSINDMTLFLNELYTLSQINRLNFNIYLFSTPLRKYTQIEINSKPELFLNQPLASNFYNLNVINTHFEPEYYGFRRLPEDHATFRRYFESQERYECEVLGIYWCNNYPQQNLRFYSGLALSMPRKFFIQKNK